MLILYPATLLNLFIGSNSFLEECFDYSIYKILSSMNNDSMSSLIPLYMPLDFPLA
jgi:hypothetical protein